MEVGVWCGVGILVLYNIVLQIKVYLLRKSAKEIRKDFQKLLYQYKHHNPDFQP